MKSFVRLEIFSPKSPFAISAKAPLPIPTASNKGVKIGVKIAPINGSAPTIVVKTRAIKTPKVMLGKALTNSKTNLSTLRPIATTAFPTFTVIFARSAKRAFISADRLVRSMRAANFRAGVDELILFRTASKVENLKNLFKNIVTVEWGEIPDFDMVINATSVGLKNNDKLNIDFSKIEKGKFFYDVIYNPEETNFLKLGKNFGCKIENGKKMFIYQAAEAFKIWHGIYPKINHKVIDLLNK